MLVTEILYANLNKNLNFSEKEYIELFKKLEYKFKKSDHILIELIKNKNPISDDNLKILLKKFEYSYRKKGSSLIIKISKHLKLTNYSPISYNKLKA